MTRNQKGESNAEKLSRYIRTVSVKEMLRNFWDRDFETVSEIFEELVFQRDYFSDEQSNKYLKILDMEE